MFVDVTPSVSWPDLSPTRLTSFRPVVLCSSCWRSPGRSSWGLQSPAARHPPTTLRPPTTLGYTARVIAATLGRRRGWGWVPPQVYLGYLCSGVQSQQRCWAFALALTERVFFSFLFQQAGETPPAAVLPPQPDTWTTSP